MLLRISSIPADEVSSSLPLFLFLSFLLREADISCYFLLPGKGGTLALKNRQIILCTMFIREERDDKVAVDFKLVSRPPFFLLGRLSISR